MTAERSDGVIRAAVPADLPSVTEIYNHYIANSIATFEETPVSGSEMGLRHARLSASHPWLVACVHGRVVGYAYAAPWKSRSAYRYSVESTVYLAPDQLGLGHGRRLYEALIADLRPRDFHSVIGGISLPNEASVALHERVGFRAAGVLREVGRKFDRWIDVGYWVLVL
jgi:phosphinothricin acetyltransferase